MLRMNYFESRSPFSNHKLIILILHRKGIADEPLAKEDVERGRKLGIEGSNGLLRSSCSSPSVSTVSTGLSHSRRPSTKDRKPKLRELPLSSIQNRENRGNPKRRRSSTVSSISYSSGSSFRKQCRNRSREPLRNIRRRRASRSPDSRGRNRHDSRRATINPTGSDWKLRQNSGYSSSSRSPDSPSERRPRGGSRIGKFSSGRHSSVSPDLHGRGRNFQGKRSNRRSRSHSYSRDRSRVARNRQSMTPGAPPQWNGGPKIRKSSDANTRNRRYSNDNDRYGGSLRGADRGIPRTSHFPQPRRKERSLSPFSKRVALTQAMNTGS